MDAEEDGKPAAKDADDDASHKSSKDDSVTAGTAGAPDSKSAQSVAKPAKGAINEHVNARVAKHFDAGLFFGTISKYDPKLKFWSVEYDDGDDEE